MHDDFQYPIAAGYPLKKLRAQMIIAGVVVIALGFFFAYLFGKNANEGSTDITQATWFLICQIPATLTVLLMFLVWKFGPKLNLVWVIDRDHFKVDKGEPIHVSQLTPRAEKNGLGLEIFDSNGESLAFLAKGEKFNQEFFRWAAMHWESVKEDGSCSTPSEEAPDPEPWGLEKLARRLGMKLIYVPMCFIVLCMVASFFPIEIGFVEDREIQAWQFVDEAPMRLDSLPQGEYMILLDRTRYFEPAVKGYKEIIPANNERIYVSKQEIEQVYDDLPETHVTDEVDFEVIPDAKPISRDEVLDRYSLESTQVLPMSKGDLTGYSKTISIDVPYTGVEPFYAYSQKGKESRASVILLPLADMNYIDKVESVGRRMLFWPIYGIIGGMLALAFIGMPINTFFKKRYLRKLEAEQGEA